MDYAGEHKEPAEYLRCYCIGWLGLEPIGKSAKHHKYADEKHYPPGFATTKVIEVDKRFHDVNIFNVVVDSLFYNHNIGGRCNVDRDPLRYIMFF